MQKNAIEIDIILDILKKAAEVYPSSAFINSLFIQYRERGSLSKKQLEGLYGKASKISSLPPGKLATLQAIILKKPNRYKSTASRQLPDETDDVAAGKVQLILEKYPQHKRVLYFKMKLDKKEKLSVLEKNELEKFIKLIM